MVDAAVSERFFPVPFRGNASWEQVAADPSFDRVDAAPRGAACFWGLPFAIGRRPVLLQEGGHPVAVKLAPCRAAWLVVAHASGRRAVTADSRRHGAGRLAEIAARYALLYADGSEHLVAIKRRHHLGAHSRGWGENCVAAVAHGSPRPVPPAGSAGGWGRSQTRVDGRDSFPFTWWLWAWANPFPDREIVGLRAEPVAGSVVLGGLSAGQASSHPLRWRPRRKAVLRLPAGAPLASAPGADGQWAGLRLDMGQIISMEPRWVYPDREWERTANNALPRRAPDEVLVEYASHEDACFHLAGRQAVLPVAEVERRLHARVLVPVRPADQLVRLRVVDGRTGRPVAAKLHVHGAAGEYLPPTSLHRYPNSNWFEDYSPEFQHQGIHRCVYIDGETELRVPLGSLYVEIAKGFEIRPIRRRYRITRATTELTVALERVLHWRDAGWVSADTHVHFLSPKTALLEGAAEGVNVVNLLASQWGELMTNVGDFDGRTVFGAREHGGDGEYLLRVGTENRQHVLGHISLVGYEGAMITPMTTGGPDESALGDPVEVLLTEWAERCRRQRGLVVIPHFPNPRLEHAATIVSGNADAIEFCSWGNLYGGIDPYSLCDWYRYLNNGYLVPAVGGTDKMSATTAVGTVRSYARLAPDREFTYDNWKEAIRRAETFVSYGPLVDFAVDGEPMGRHLRLPATGGTVHAAWRVASVVLPMTRVELVANGEVIDGREVDAQADEGGFRVAVDRCTWLALLVRGRPPGQSEMIAAHSAPVMVHVEGTEFLAAADGLSILARIEGALAYVETLATRAQTEAYRRLRLRLTAIHRTLHNRMHQSGQYHQHAGAASHRHDA